MLDAQIQDVLGCIEQGEKSIRRYYLRLQASMVKSNRTSESDGSGLPFSSYSVRSMKVTLPWRSTRTSVCDLVPYNLSMPESAPLTTMGGMKIECLRLSMEGDDDGKVVVLASLFSPARTNKSKKTHYLSMAKRSGMR